MLIDLPPIDEPLVMSVPVSNNRGGLGGNQQRRLNQLRWRQPVFKCITGVPVFYSFLKRSNRVFPLQGGKLTIQSGCFDRRGRYL